ncbi:zinc finger MYM-type protein 1-like [Belonocnema kinseyi]|uniref:zinc finger MYM-type protein 1-like n=1 Tax=Belonocnema kinseyi TaxID=2817044 RepID=UPI00143DB4C5|nr:zinc finger MYM-type protein 1-like [Belonocnema kinseyi]
MHLNACVVYSKRKNHKCLEFPKNDQLDRWREILKRILDVIITLARCNLPLRGHREQVQSIDSSSGNFLNVIALLTRYDPILRSHLDNDSTKIKFMSPFIKIELIELTAFRVIKQIVDEINNCPFFAIVLDSTQDISKIDQMSVILRYVVIDSKKGFCIKESFLGFIPVRNHASKGLLEEIKQFLEKLNIDLEKYRGQAYDGARVMSGTYNGL